MICYEIVGGYRCDCDVGFMSKDCENDIDECVVVFCKNNVICIDFIGNYLC